MQATVPLGMTVLIRIMNLVSNPQVEQKEQRDDWIQSGELALLLSNFVASCESMRSVNICLLVFLFVQRRIGLGDV